MSRMGKERPVIFLDHGRYAGQYEAWACLGAGKCIEPNPQRRRRHCKDCIKADPNETVAKLLERIAAAADPAQHEEAGPE